MATAQQQQIAFDEGATARRAGIKKWGNPFAGRRSGALRRLGAWLGRTRRPHGGQGRWIWSQDGN